MATETVLRRMGYTVLRKIGEGNFGQVKLATSEKHPNQVAIKIIDSRRGSSTLVQKFLPRELAILKKVKHPHIVEVHNILKMNNGQVCIVMEAAITDLNREIKLRHHIPTGLAKTWFSQLVSAVVYLHKQDIVHRDLKCTNVLLTADYQVKLADFGLSRFSKGFPEMSETYCCTRFYAAPEVIRRQPYDPKKSDVWSLGVVLYVMVTGSVPFKEKRAHKLLRVQRKALQYPVGITVEEPCRALISYMLQYDPSTRPSVTDVEKHPWLQSRQECETGEAAGPSVAEGKSAPQENLFGTPEKHPKVDGFSSKTDADEQNTIKLLKKIRVIGRFTVEVIDEQDGVSTSHQDISSTQEDNSSRAGASLTSRSVEAVGEECGCFSCSPLCAAIKRAAKAYLVAPFLRTSQSLRGRMKRFFTVNSKVHNSSSVASTEAPASSSSKQSCEDGISDILLCGPVVEDEAVLPQPTVRQKSRWLKFPKFKVYPKKDECGLPPVDVFHGSRKLDQLLTLAEIVEGTWEYITPVYMCFVEKEKASDFVPQDIL
ncbi:testis-specific serine/threonine-protein kinase 2-like [Salminus brasiliensis]|uniref:testis-specific serine/threonine-protein kinase 2-like n=1 Tax=Salminus brasiliensis TaxID=930266 RepID=UPI003B838A41